MKQLDIISTEWKEEDRRATKKDFDKGLNPVLYFLTIKVKILNSYNPMNPYSSNPQIIIEGIGKKVHEAYQLGYHISEGWVSFNSESISEKIDEKKVKIYCVNG